MDGVSIALTIIGSVMTLLSVLIAVFTFYFNRKKDTSTDSEWRGELKSDIRHIKDGVDELKKDNTEIKEDMQDLRDRVTLVEASAKSAHKRIDTMEKQQEVKHV